MKRRALQIFIALFAIFPVVIGILDVVIGSNRYPGTGTINPGLDSAFRFYGGLIFSTGLILFWMLPKIEEHTALLRIIALGMLVGIAGRLLSMYEMGLPPVKSIFLLGVGACFPFIAVFWQKIVASDTEQKK